MKMVSQLTRLLLSSALFAVAIGSAQAAYPDKPIKLIVPYPPGGASDVAARIIGEKLSVRLGQSVIVENHPGANGLIANELVARSPGDGYTLLIANVGPTAVNPSLYKKLPYNQTRDFTPISMTAVFPIVLVVNPKLPVKNVADLIKLAKSEPGKLKCASAGPGSSNHLSCEMLKQMTGINIVHVPYRGDAPALTDVMGGQVPLMFATTVAATPFTKSGKLRPIGVATAKGAKAYPNVPVIAKTVPGFDSSSWGGILGPKNMPKPVVLKLNHEINAVLAMPDVRAKLEQQGAMVSGSTPEQFGRFISQETVKWAKVIKKAHVHIN